MFLYLNLGRSSVESRTYKTMNRSRRHPLKEITKQRKYEGALHSTVKRKTAQ